MDSGALCCTPFDPLVDTETFGHVKNCVKNFTSCTPFDPLVDTETASSNRQRRNRRRCTPFDPLVDTETTCERSE